MTDAAVQTAGARRLEGGEKVRGETRFAQDLRPPGVLHVRLVLCPYPSARIGSIDRSAALAAPGVVAVVTGQDLPALEVAGPDRPLAVDRAYYAGQPVAAVLAESEASASDGAALLQVDYEQLPAVTDPFEAMKDGAPQVLDQKAEGFDDVSIHGGGGTAEAEPADRRPNVSSVAQAGRGDIEAGFAAAEAIVSGHYFMPGAHQGFIEPHVVIAAPQSGGVILWTPTQGHHFARAEVAKLLGVSLARVRVVPTPVGGGFGGKVVLLEPLAALLARHAGRPVQIALTRSEDFQVGRSAPASHTDLRLGATRDGLLTALQVDMVWDNGASSGWHGNLAGILFSAAYRIPAYKFTAQEVSTNKTPVDAYRAPGGTQAFFALESALDELAAKLGIDPIELRLKNAVTQGPKLEDGSRGEVGFVRCLELAREHPLYTGPREEGEGVGVAAGGWGGAYGPAAAICRVEPDGSLTVQIGSIDISGSATGMALIASEAFGIPIEKVAVELGDTGTAPQSPVAGGSAITYSVGPAVALAAADARKQVLDIASESLEAGPEDLEIVDGEIRVKGVPDRKISIGELAGGGTTHPPVLGRGQVRVNGQSPAFTVHICRAIVDRGTGLVRVTGYAAIQDVGHAVNPPEVEGQIHGGAAQGLGRALGEQMHYDAAGTLRTGSFLDYELPTADLIPAIEVVIVEVPSLQALGTRGVGEPPAVPGPAALVNAVASATGVRIRSLPISAEALLQH